MSTTILPSARTPFDVYGQQLAQALGPTLTQSVERMSNRNLLQESLGKVSEIANNPNPNNLDLLTSLMQAGAGIPGSERYLGSLIPEVLKIAEARRSAKYTQPGSLSRGYTNDPSLQAAKNPPQSIPQGISEGKAILQQPKGTEQFFPTTIPTQGGPGHVIKPSTTQQILPLRSPEQIDLDIPKMIQQRHSEGNINFSAADARKELEEENNRRELHNTRVEKDIEKRISGQKKYGQMASDILENKYPDATNEMKAIFKKIGEEESESGASEADIERKLDRTAQDFANSISRVKNSLDAPRWTNNAKRLTEAKSWRDYDKAASDIREHIQPLLDLGLYDTSRKMLAEKNYGREEREAILNPLSPQSESIMSQLPKRTIKSSEITAFPTGSREKSGPKRVEDITPLVDSLMKMSENQPNFSPILARRMAMDKNFTWREFKDSWDEAKRLGMKITTDQINQTGELDTPPQGLLDKFLEGIGIIGK